MRLPERRTAQRLTLVEPPEPAFRRGSRAEAERPPGNAARGMVLAALLSSLFWLGLAWAL
ncbi:hypothetical protein ACLF3G_14140 [Falsiroseomonas sp. HC035]|uniref:hypothetical protein n=1 Tax=Falsiroseomonas sp. HC035 TaxID=3390999 RepID=UPI003D319A76